MPSTVPIEIWLRASDRATTHEITGVPEAAAWTDADVDGVLKAMLRAMDRAQNPGAEERPVFLRGFSWIVSPYESGGVVIAIEMQLGAAVAGPFDIGQRELEQMVARVMELGRAAPPAVH